MGVLQKGSGRDQRVLIQCGLQVDWMAFSLSFILDRGVRWVSTPSSPVYGPNHRTLVTQTEPLDSTTQHDDSSPHPKSGTGVSEWCSQSDANNLGCSGGLMLRYCVQSSLVLFLVIGDDGGCNGDINAKGGRTSVLQPRSSYFPGRNAFVYLTEGSTHDLNWPPTLPRAWP
jgi:hypothetical protein